jgi:hypothetical protein
MPRTRSIHSRHISSRGIRGKTRGFHVLTVHQSLDLSL